MKILKLQKYFKDFTRGKSVAQSGSRKNIEPQGGSLEQRRTSQPKKYNMNTYESEGNI